MTNFRNYPDVTPYDPENTHTGGACHDNHINSNILSITQRCAESEWVQVIAIGPDTVSRCCWYLVMMIILREEEMSDLKNILINHI